MTEKQTTKPPKVRRTGLEKLVASIQKRMRRILPNPAPSWRQSTGAQDYGHQAYWIQVGAPLLDEAFREGGLWTRILNVDQCRQLREARNFHQSDLVAVLYLIEKQLSEW
jgi:hypothetical protein